MELVLVILFLGAVGAAIYFAVKAQSGAAEVAKASNLVAGLQQQVARLQHEGAVAHQEAASVAGGLRRELGSRERELAAAKEEAARVGDGLRRQVVGLEQRVGVLARYQQVVDAEAAAVEVRGRAAAQAAQVVEEAIRRAEEIAGAALVAMRDAKRLEETAQAMRNVIEGYGDRYVMPTAGLLDELAEELGFAEAGQKLKAAREKTRGLIKQGRAAACDYVEANRRATAVEFVVDAFNGKVDTILADVRDDNFGTLERKVRDAFVLVNHNGKAFRDARITGEYLEARLDELRWAVVATELKAREREEQRRIKERIREEERVQRELEKAQRDAEKEQETLRKAMEKARREVEKSTDVERAKLEEKLLELEGKLRVAEEKGQRALSMAQQTKAGTVYVISNVGSFGEDVFKIGMTRRVVPEDRVRELGDASVPFEFDVHALVRTNDAPALEHALHRKFVRSQVNKVNPRKEFFRLPLSEIRAEIDKLGTAVSWTLTAAAREYRETLAVEQALANKTLDEAKWAQSQEVATPTFDEQEMEAATV